MLLDLLPGDEIIIPAFTHVSTANVFASKGLKVVLIDSGTTPNVDLALLENAITLKTKAIVVMHYAGMAVDMSKLLRFCKEHKIWLIEDAATCIDAFYLNENNVKHPLGSIGHISTFSFHHTKNVISGEGGMLVVNDVGLVPKADLIWDRGTNRDAFLNGKVTSYNWVGKGGSFAPSELVAAFLWAQCLELDKIQQKRREIWNNYWVGLRECLGRTGFSVPNLP